MDEMDGGAAVTETAATDTVTTDEGGGYDVESASADLASDLFPSREASDSDTDSDTDSEPVVAEDKPEPTPQRSAPKSWSKEMHESYGKLDPAVQDYIDSREESMHSGIAQYKEFNEFGKQMSQAMAPYQDLIQREGVDAPRAVQALLNAHKLLRESGAEQKKTYFMQLAKDYGIELGEQGEQAPVDPAYKALMDKVQNLEGNLNKRHQAERDAAYKNVTSEVEAFAADKAHPYFDEVSDDIVLLLKTGIELKDAYEKAVWANPVTRQKEIERMSQETEAGRAKKAHEEALKTKAATAANIRNRDTRRTPTEGNRATMRDLDSALKETMSEIKSRSH